MMCRWIVGHTDLQCMVMYGNRTVGSISFIIVIWVWKFKPWRAKYAAACVRRKLVKVSMKLKCLTQICTHIWPPHVYCSSSDQQSAFLENKVAPFICVKGCRICRPSQRILAHYLPQLAKSCAAIHTSMDGNCLFNAMSRALYGDERHHSQLRLRAVIEMILNIHFYESSR